MTVAELIAVLQTCDPDEHVHIGYDAMCVMVLEAEDIQRGRDMELTLWAN